ncbi:DUF397 domain-containing protein [Streptomyces avicenniae]|uniref:DUF397 domain-containing protein n=1 Tax=Streptomyces avicenniae TaxID=500153 RepID=UPI000699C5F7|nr:DUF397 domain-containing protein [Streptomyces avicenniae]
MKTQEAGDADLARAAWRAPRRSQANGACVEVADNIPGLVPVRDSKNPGPVIIVPAHAWTTFTDHLKH